MRAWMGAMYGHTDVLVVKQAVEQAHGWVSKARYLLEPHPPFRMRGVSCPACGAELEERSTAEGEAVLAGVLEVMISDGIVRCVPEECAAEWTPDAWEGLAAHIARQTTRETDALELEHVE